MIINYVKIKNFRGIHHEQRFDFGKKFVLLSASNGMGKTTVIDAIEWALTGSIGRLKAAYDMRSKNDTERKSIDNLAGILKNKNASPKEPISVELGLIAGNQNFVIRREQVKDGLIGVKNQLTVTPKEPGLQIIHNIEKSSFYTYHFCDIQKSLNLQATKREDFSDLFKDFITDYRTEETIAANLELFLDDLDRYLEDLGRQESKNHDEIDACTTRLQEFQQQPALISYPSTAIYSGEQLDVQNMTEDQLNEQLQQIYECGYQKVCLLLTSILSHRHHSQIISQLLALQETVTDKKEPIGRAIATVQKYGSLSKAKEPLQTQMSRYSNMQISKETLDTYAPKIIKIGSSEFTQEIYSQKIQKIHESNTAIQHLKEDIVALTEGNRILAVLSSLLSHKEDLIFYKNQGSTELPVACPVCGSTTFGEMADADVLLDAQNYTNDNKDRVTHKKEEIQSLQKTISAEYEALIKAARSAVQSACESLQKQFAEVDNLEQTTAPFFSMVSSLQKNDVPVELVQWANTDHLQERLQYHKKFLLSEEQIRLLSEQYQDLLKCLDFSVDGTDTEESIFTRVKSAIHGNLTLEKTFTLELVANKINSLKSMLHSQTYLVQSANLKQLKEREKEIRDRIQEYKNLKLKVNTQKDHIRETIAQLKSQEYEAVGPNLCRFYKKLARVDSVQEVRLSHDSGKMALVDEKGKNLVNILSNGQLGVFMLSYFFAGLLSRKDTEPCKIYFIDDLTACMDDVNMLSFLDLMKYQMQEENDDAGIDQMFFASCDYRVCELLRYKLSGSNIPYSELSDKEFANLS